MKVLVIASGSEGNATLINSACGSILIDAGVSYLKIKDAFKTNNFDIHQLNGILITHIHHDHVQGLASLVKKNNTKVYIPAKMYSELNRIIDESYIEIIEDNFIIQDFNINLIYTSHDVECSVGYVINHNDKSLVYITDTGYINTRYYPLITNRNAYIIESNHDEEMVTTGNYPYCIKTRILSDYGHLSNNTTAKHLKKIIGEKTEYIILAHISQNNNSYDLALETTSKKLGSLLDSKILLVAKQGESLDLIEV